MTLLLDEITRKSFKKSFGARCQCCDTSHPHGLDLRTRTVSAGIARREARDETRRGESYSAGLTARARRESCQFRSDPRVRVPETAGLALVSTRIPPARVLISITAAVWEEFRRANSHAFFSPAKATRTVLSATRQSGSSAVATYVSNFRYPRLANSTLCALMMGFPPLMQGNKCAIIYQEPIGNRYDLIMQFSTVNIIRKACILSKCLFR